MSFGESVFLAGFIQKTVKGGSKRQIESRLSTVKTTPEGSRGHWKPRH
jgi:hypothetical protein